MNLPALSELATKITQLSQEEQLWLIEKLAHSLRETQLKDQTVSGNQLVAMASDPEIQSELRQIAQEFAFTESDGLEGVW